MGDQALEGIAKELAVHYQMPLGSSRSFGAITSSCARNSVHELYLEDEASRTMLRFIRDLGQGESGRRYEQVSVSAADGVYELAYKTTTPAQSATKFAPFAETQGDTLDARFARTLGQMLPGLDASATSYRLPIALTREELGDVAGVIIRYLSADTVLPPLLSTSTPAPDASRS